MSKQKIESVLPDDFPELFKIELRAHSVPWSLGTLQNSQGGRYLNLKYLQNSQIVGFVICQTVLDEATLFNIAVAPEMQGRGIGKSLLLELIKQLKERGITALWLEVRESNFKAQKLYENLGFNQVDIRKNYYPTPEGKRENAIVMALYLI